MAYCLARQWLPEHTSRFSRHDFTLPQLFACLAAKDLLKCSYRRVEAILCDSPEWLAGIGLSKAPDHNTLCRAAKAILSAPSANRLLDGMITVAVEHGMIDVDKSPVAIDSTSFDSHHVSRHYEHRRRQSARASKGAAKGKNDERAEKRRVSTRSATVRRLPKLAVAVACGSHMILSIWTGTGLGADHGNFGPLLTDALGRLGRNKFKVAADAGYDAESIHELARDELGVETLIPPLIGRPRKDGGPPGGRWRAAMAVELGTGESRRASGYTQRWQVETVNSVMKRNQGAALAGRTAHSRKRDMRLRALTHNVMVLP